MLRSLFKLYNTFVLLQAANGFHDYKEFVVYVVLIVNHFEFDPPMVFYMYKMVIATIRVKWSFSHKIFVSIK